MDGPQGSPHGRSRPLTSPRFPGAAGARDVRRGFEAWRLLMALLMVLCSALHMGWTDPIIPLGVLRIVQFSLLLGYSMLLLLQHLPRGMRVSRAWLGDQFSRPDRIVAALGVAMSWWWPALDIAGSLLLLTHAWGFYLWLLQRGVNPGLIFVGSFAVLILLGSAALMMPAATPADRPIDYVDALFTATSATCVTGLTVRDTNLEFTRFGQSVILALIQLGGLGTILFGAIVALLLGSSLSLRAVHAVADSAAAARNSADAVRKLVLFSAAVIFGAELLGAGLLYFGWPQTWDQAPADIAQPGARLFYALFTSVSAFCNAGFGSSSNNLESLRTHWTSHVVVAGLIVIGGIGLPVYANLAQIVRARLRGVAYHGGALVRLSLHTKMVLIGTGTIYLIGFLGIFLSQWFQRDLPPGLAALDAHFTSITARTAGFDTVLPADMGPLARLTTVLSMFIGGSPSSTAGGIKTVVAGILVLMLWSVVLNRDQVRGFGRTIPGEMLRKAATLLMAHLLLCGSITTMLVVTEAHHFPTPTGMNGDVGFIERMLFEAVSACSTVGLTLNTTANLSDTGKLVVVMGMFIGRVGSVAFLVALVGVVKRERSRYEYPSEGVVLS